MSNAVSTGPSLQRIGFLRYEGKNAVVIGGTSGIGLATAALLRDEGAHVVVTGRSADTVRTARRILGDGATVLRSDASSMDDITALAEQVRGALGGIDALCITAGVTRQAPLDRMDEATWDGVMAVNTKGPYFTVQRLAPLIRPGGGIVLTTSVSDVKGLPGDAAYAASKAALRSLARTLSRDLLPHGVRVNAVSPGPIDTGIIDRAMPPDVAATTKQAMRERNPMRRFGKPEEVAKAIAFLAFEATYTTGAELCVDGGTSQL